MSDRREFPRKIKAQIVHNAMNAKGQLVCEGCGLVLGKKRYEIDHIIAEGLVVDKTQPLTAKDGEVLGVDCCHRGPDGKTSKDVTAIAKAKRVELKRLGIRKRSTFPKPPPGSRHDWKLGRRVFDKETR